MKLSKASVHTLKHCITIFDQEIGISVFAEIYYVNYERVHSVSKRAISKCVLPVNKGNYGKPQGI
ncbi:MAG: hypothetical protein DUD35_10860 [Lactobacillus sp.]|jgi:hypothetical protein|nr:hypothetical protein HMPREF0496_1074 [Lentilactobacillus hilgardii ATCC 27305]MCT3392875.1 hypothetical protein [Lentilactobacillus hilgardii]RRG08905.1 MAG: hypothetical protein DUD35_10860 [Lactobacillus sp.]